MFERADMGYLLEVLGCRLLALGYLPSTVPVNRDSSEVSHNSLSENGNGRGNVAHLTLFTCASIGSLATPIVGWFQQGGPVFGRAARMGRFRDTSGYH